MNDPLNQPLQLREGLVLGNRIAKSAMSERLADEDGAPGEGLVRLYERWADGGAALLITGNVMIDGTALGETGNVVLEDDRALDRFERWAAAARGTGTQVWMQINHPGRQVPRIVSTDLVAPSAIALGDSDEDQPANASSGSKHRTVRWPRGMFAKPRALEPEEIEAIVQRFATTASLARRAGFTGVQIHGAHGYLISQFLSPKTNRRDDDWGGTEEKRRRFLLEVVRAVRRAVGPDFGLGLKLNSADFQHGGFRPEASMAVVEALEGEGIDLLEISGGTYESAAMFEETRPTRDSSKKREAFFMQYAEDVRARTTLPLMLTGGFRTKEGMSDALASGAVDVVGLARPLAVEPDLPKRMLSGEAEAATPVRLATGIKMLDDVIQGGWYQTQIHRMANGEAPKVGLSRLTATWRYLFPKGVRSASGSRRPESPHPPCATESS
jgi:2,4-dienoyl-CoA reductase-like NADH-dependent reductase (Old Yellow Enzyme family)